MTNPNYQQDRDKELRLASAHTEQVKKFGELLSKHGINGFNYTNKIKPSVYNSNYKQDSVIPNQTMELLFKKPVGSPKLPEEKKLEKPIPINNRKSLMNFSTDGRPTPDAPPEFQVAQYDNTKPTKYSFTYPTGKYNEQKSVYFPDAGTWKQFIGSQKLINSDEGKGYGTATGYLKKGGLTANGARQILHDGTAQGHPLTDKQRRFFGAKSKGHTNFRGRK